MTGRPWFPVVLALTALMTACDGPPGDPVEIVIPSGAPFADVTDTLGSREIIRAPGLFAIYARVRRDDRRIKAGRYALPTGSRWRDVLEILTAGRVETVPLTIPEGFRLPQIAPRIAALTGVPEDEVLAVLGADDVDSAYSVPGPGLEGYLFPDTYRFARGVGVGEVIRAMTDRYKEVWTEPRQELRDSLGLDERELVTLASIIEAEARKVEEMPRISSVYHNRLRQGWLLQADPTVLYALGGPRERLLFAAIDSVADNPYNTYRNPGLPPGPIGAPGEAAIDAALQPAEEAYLYFVAWPDGSHVFTRTLAEHNRAIAESRRERERLRAEAERPARGSQR
jgi:UPF0755 protein